MYVLIVVVLGAYVFVAGTCTVEETQVETLLNIIYTQSADRTVSSSVDSSAQTLYALICALQP